MTALSTGISGVFKNCSQCLSPLLFFPFILIVILKSCIVMLHFYDLITRLPFIKLTNPLQFHYNPQFGKL